MADSRFVRSWHGGCGDEKVGGYVDKQAKANLVILCFELLFKYISFLSRTNVILQLGYRLLSKEDKKYLLNVFTKRFKQQLWRYFFSQNEHKSVGFWALFYPKIEVKKWTFLEILPFLFKRCKYKVLKYISKASPEVNLYS